MIDQHLPIAVIGAGPVGLAAAAHIIDRGEVPLVLEAGGQVAPSVRAWSHVRMFSPWEFTVDHVAAKLLRDAGWIHPPKDELPTGGELVAAYLEPLAALPSLRDCIRLGTRVVAVTRKGFDKVRSLGRAEQPFVIRTLDRSGREESFEAKAVIDASGTWTQPNPAGADGLPAIGEPKFASRIAYGIPDVLATQRSRYAGKTVLVVGGGHSAINALVELAELRESAPGTRILWAMRKEHIEAAYGGEEADALPARGALGSQARALVESGAVTIFSPFRISRIDAEAAQLAVTGDHAGKQISVRADEIIVATGFRPDLSFLRELRLSLDPWLESSGQIGPLIDPNLHSCGTVRPHGAKELAHAESGFYIAGMKSYGRAPTFLLATGHEQARSIVAALTGDIEAAERVELQLPETGVCVTRPVGKRPAAADESSAGSACCGPGLGKRAPVRVEIAASAKSSCGAGAKSGSGCGTRAKERPNV
jgi:thioredoxin reductase